MEILNYQTDSPAKNVGLYLGEAALTAAAVALVFRRVQPSLRTATAIGAGCMSYALVMLGGSEVKPINDYGMAFAGPLLGLQLAALGWGLKIGLGVAGIEAIAVKGMILTSIIGAKSPNE